MKKEFYILVIAFLIVFLSQFQTISWAYTKKGFSKKKTKTKEKKELR
jgi:hypothetical protein